MLRYTFQRIPPIPLVIRLLKSSIYLHRWLVQGEEMFLSYGCLRDRLLLIWKMEIRPCMNLQSVTEEIEGYIVSESEILTHDRFEI